jgi:hypothetical protein
MDSREFNLRTETVRREVGPDVFKVIQEETRQDPRIAEMAQRIRELRLVNKIAADELIERNRDLIDSVRAEVLGRHGIHLDLEELEEKIEAKRQERLKGIHGSLTGDESDAEILYAFGLTDEEGQLSEKSVESTLFKERTRLAFEAYLSTVKSFEALVDYNQMFGVPTKNIGRADEIRSAAHDEVAKQVGDDLGLDFDMARNLVAKIRDDKMPGSGEQEVYSRSAIRLGKRLSKRYYDDLAEAVEDEAKPIFEDKSE